MASREEVYRKFGMAAEAAQLLETELGTLLIGMRGLSSDWHISAPDRETGTKAVAEIDAQTLGSMLKVLRNMAQVDDVMTSKLTSALKARNRLIHGFYERHNFKIDTDAGRDVMMTDLDSLHEELFHAWRLASAMSDTFLSIFNDLKKRQVGVAKIGEYLAEFGVEKRTTAAEFARD